MTWPKLALGIALGCVLGGIALTPALAQNAAPPDLPPAMTVVGACPSQEAIWADIRSMVPASDLGKVTAAKVEVSDLGATYRVKIVGDDRERQRTFHDVEHDCDHRARFAAIFAVVTLLPPDVLLESPPEPPPPPPARPAPAPPAVAAAPPPRSRPLRIELSGLFDAAPSIGGTGDSVTFGGEVRSFWGAKRLAAVVGLGIEPRASFDFGGVGVNELRVPLDAGLALVSARSRLTLVGEVGVAGAVVRIAGTNTATTQSGTRVDLGGRLGFGLRFGSSSSTVAPVVGIHALIFPRPYEATTTPSGDIGRLPALWLGLTAGASFAP
ncbi:MAG TPA: hypothetical protein VHG72_18015 [Polyangia bacterium]|nr:hypothetical protein [Polyangia bacterium]